MTKEKEIEELVGDLCYLDNNPFTYDTYDMQAWYLIEEEGWHKQLTAEWKTRVDRNDYTWVECSNCGFLVENYKAVETGVSSTDIVGYRWHACPKCTAKMIMNKEDKYVSTVS